jgi:hypothetical protein
MGPVDSLPPGYYVTRTPDGLRYWIVLDDGGIAEVPPGPARARRNQRTTTPCPPPPPPPT